MFRNIAYHSLIATNNASEMSPENKRHKRVKIQYVCYYRDLESLPHKVSPKLLFYSEENRNECHFWLSMIQINDTFALTLRSLVLCIGYCDDNINGIQTTTETALRIDNIVEKPIEVK